MLKNEIKENSLFGELSGIASSFGMVIVDVNKTVRSGGEIHVSITVMNIDGDTGIDDCEKFHRAVLPLLELKIGRDVLSTEVETPGLQRNFKDFYEFSVFTERRCRLYSLNMESWIQGVINKVENDMVEMTGCIVENSGEKCDSMKFGIDDIQKAKLDWKFEDLKKNKKNFTGDSNVGIKRSH
ncbi:MAG: hypothetical protein MJ052_03270 [Sphaerochaetaceae bacterium]|nr:hypothetical protein [Sphaerochaetaceae bacterium]